MRAAVSAATGIASLPGVASASVEIPGAPEHFVRTVTVAPEVGRKTIPIAQSPLFHAVDGAFFTISGFRSSPAAHFRLSAKAGAPAVAIVNETTAEVGTDLARVAIGRHLLVGDNDSTRSWLTVVGVSGNAKLIDVFSAGPYRPVVYRPFEQAPIRGAWLLVRTKGDSAQAMRSVIAAQREFTHRQYTRGTSILSLEGGLDSDLSREKVEAVAIDALAAFSLLLVGLGVYGVIAYDATRRTREFGIRIALGADRQQVLATAARSGLSIAVLGVGLGAVVAVALARVTRTLIPGSSGTSPLLLAGAATALLATVLVAAYLPARRATAIDPMEAMRVD